VLVVGRGEGLMRLGGGEVEDGVDFSMAWIRYGNFFWECIEQLDI
jgi:hypothetical protein